MRAIVQEYLENPSDKLLNQMTSEEQRFLARQDPPKKSKAKKSKAKATEGESQDEPQEANS